jgi:membrane-associated phospholipid phosphatase
MIRFRLDNGTWERLAYPLVACFILLAIIFAIWDLQISTLLVDSGVEWAKFVADYGEIPGNIIIIIALLIFYASNYRIDKTKSILITGGVIGGLVWQVYSLVTAIFEGSNSQILPVIFVFVIVTLVVVRLGKPSIPREFQSFSVFTLALAIINPLLFVQVVKILWGRIRFRDLAPDFTNFTPWFLPRGPTGHRSFPSGHTAMGWMLLPFLNVPRFKNNKAIYYLGTSIILCWGVIVALGRVVIGAHYASDVLFSTGMAWSVFIVYNIYVKRKILLAQKIEIK